MITILLSALFLSPAHAELSAVYEVPVPAHLQEFARFPLDELFVKEEEGKVKVYYPLPLEITGVENRIRFEGKRGRDGLVHLGTANGSSMECRLEAKETICSAHYHGVVQDLEAVEALLDSMNLTNEEKAARLAVARHVVRPLPIFASVLASIRESGGDMEGRIIFSGDVFGLSR